MNGLEKLTIKQLKDIIRNYKKDSCPPYSKLKKTELEALVSKLGLSITLIPKKPKPKPQPKPQPKPEEEEYKILKNELNELNDRTKKPSLDTPKRLEYFEVRKKIRDFKKKYPNDKTYYSVLMSTYQNYIKYYNRLYGKPDKPKPQPKPEPKKIKDITNSITAEDIDKYNASGNQSWVASQSNMLLVYDYILDKHSNDCIPIVKSLQGQEAILIIEVEKAHTNNPIIQFAWNKDGKSYDLPATEEELKLSIKKIRECKKRFIPLPFGFQGNTWGHLNMIILDLQNNTAEHLEPHGNEFRGSGESKGLKKVIKEDLPKLFEDWGFKYSNPNESCPYKIGVQSIQSRYNTDKISKVVQLDAFNKFSGKQGGLCALWSYILLDLRLSNPDFTIQEILKETLKEKSIEEFNASVLEDYKKSLNTFSKDLFENEKDYNLALYNKWSEGEKMKLGDTFFMYAITFAHEAFGKNTSLLVKLMKEEAEKNDMSDFMDFLKISGINPFKLMWYFSNVKVKKIVLVYKTDKQIKVVKNPKDIFTYAFYRNVEPKLKQEVFDRLLNKSSIRVLKEEKKEDN